MKPDEAMQAIMKEYMYAKVAYDKFHSHHEGWAVLFEEVEELWDEIKKKSESRDVEKIQKEATQAGAMALRFLIDLC